SDNHTVNQEFDERPPLLEGRRVQTGLDLSTKRLERRCDRAQGEVLLRHGVELPLLALQRLLPTGQLAVLPFKHGQGEDARQRGVEQALLGCVALSQGMAQRRVPGLELLGEPLPTMRTA